MAMTVPVISVLFTPSFSLKSTFFSCDLFWKARLAMPTVRLSLFGLHRMFAYCTVSLTCFR